MPEMPAHVPAQIIDAHHHLWRYSPREYGWITPDMEVLQRNFLPDDLEPEMRTAGVEGSVAVQARQSLAETRWLLDLAERSATIQGVVGWVPMTAADLPATLRKLSARSKLKGVRHSIQDEPDDDYILGAGFNRGVDALLDAGLAYDILIHERHLPQTVQFVAQHPHQTFILDHLAKPRIRAAQLQPWSDNMRRLAEHENVYCKLSGLVTEAHWATWCLGDLSVYLDAALAIFGAERLMAGSDWPVCLLAANYKQWWSCLHQWCAGLQPHQREQILGNTARTAYRLY